MKYWLVIISVFLGGCQDIERPEKPKDLIPKDKMVEVLTEAYLSNAAQSIRNQSVFKEEINLDSLLYAKFDIDSLQFLNSNNYYAMESSLYIEILEEVEANLEHIENRLDSIRKVRQEQHIESPKNVEDSEEE